MIFLAKKSVWILFIVYLTLKNKFAFALEKITTRNISGAIKKIFLFFFVSSLK